MSKRATVSCLIAMAIAAAGCKTTSLSSTPATASTTHSTPATSSAPETTSTPTTASHVAHVNSTITVSNGTQTADITLVKIIDPATPGNQYLTPTTGKRFVGVEISIAATTGLVTGNANIDLAAIGTNNQTYTADFDPIAGCTNFNSGEFTVAAGDTNTGCVTYQIPTGVTVNKVQFTPDGGLAPGVTAAQWLVP